MRYTDVRTKSISSNASTTIFLQPNIQRVTKFFLLIFLCIFFSSSLLSQTSADSAITGSDTALVKKKSAPKDVLFKRPVHKKDSTRFVKPDTLVHLEKKLNSPLDIPEFSSALLENPWFNFLGKMQSQNILLHEARSEDGLFYLILGLCFYFAFIKLAFNKYVANLLSLFFRASMRQQQMREQAQQTPFPSLLLNILFVLSSGLYACFLIRYYHFAGETGFWLLFVNCILIIAAIYVAKFCALKLCGWIFNITKAADNYIFIIFLVNKIAGFALLPVLVLVSFSNSFTAEVAITVSIIMIAILFIYRFAACYASLRSEIKISLFHYFIYLCAFEIAPLLLIYKIALTYLKKAY